MFQSIPVWLCEITIFTFLFSSLNFLSPFFFFLPGRWFSNWNLNEKQEVNGSREIGCWVISTLQKCIKSGWGQRQSSHWLKTTLLSHARWILLRHSLDAVVIVELGRCAYEAFFWLRRWNLWLEYTLLRFICIGKERSCTKTLLLGFLRRDFVDSDWNSETYRSELFRALNQSLSCSVRNYP